MGERDEKTETNNEGGEGPQGESRAGNEGPLSYRKNEEDSTMLREEEQTGEGTGAKAGEYS